MTTSKMVLAVFVMALVTYLPRALPLVAFRGRIQSKFIRSFLYYIPYAVLAAMTFPAILYSTGNVVTAIIGLSSAIIMSFLGFGLLPVAVVAVLFAFLAQFFV